MEIKGPRVVVQNTDGGHWLVSVTDFISSSDGESVSFVTTVRRSDKPMPEIVREATQRAIELLQDSLTIR